MTLRYRSAAMLVLWCAVPISAGAQSRVAYVGLLTPHIGVTTGGDAEDPGFTPGVSLGVLESRGWGVELDIAHAATVGDERFNDSGLTSAMLNLLYVWPRPGLEPFGLVGAGVLRLSGVRAADGGSDSRTDIGVMFGGGAHVRITEVFGIRGDVRYVRFLEAHPDVPANGGVFGTWRISAGVTLNWPLEP